MTRTEQNIRKFRKLSESIRNRPNSYTAAFNADCMTEIAMELKVGGLLVEEHNLMTRLTEARRNNQKRPELKKRLREIRSQIAA